MNNMHILHYLYGMPPYRGGGMIKYALDLAEEEKKMGHQVSILYPGSIYKRNSNDIIIKKEKADHKTNIYRIQNPLPIPLGSGIRDFEWFTSGQGFAVYEDFLKKIKPDVIHVHSLMGIHKSFFEAAGKLKIRMVYTSHDYFGLCPVTTLMKEKECCREEDWRKCSWCCRNAFSAIHLMMDQSWMVQHILQTIPGKVTLNLLTRLKAQHLEAADQEAEIVYTDQEKYQKLNEHYKSMLKKMDFYHFNSKIAETEFTKRIGKVNGCVLPITNSSCTDQRRRRDYSESCPLRVGFLGGNNEFKGFPVLHTCIRELVLEGCALTLNTYFGAAGSEEKFWKQHQPYSYSELEKVMNENDVIVVPSIWKETFGLVVMEALSFGVPVIVSEHVGAGMLLEQKEEMGKVLKGDLYVELKNCLKEISANKSILEKWNANICKADIEFSMEKHAKKVVDICYEGTNDEKETC